MRAHDKTLSSSGSDLMVCGIILSGYIFDIPDNPVISSSGEVSNMTMRYENLGLFNTSSSSSKSEGFMQSCSFPCLANLRSLFGMPSQRRPEIITFVSMTTFIWKLFFLCDSGVLLVQFLLAGVLFLLPCWIFLLHQKDSTF